MPANPPRRHLELRLKACQEALARQPTDPQRILVVGAVLRDLQRTDEALACYRQAAALELSAGRRDQAAQICREILDWLPEDEDARVLLEHLSNEGSPRTARAVVLPPGGQDLIPANDEDPTSEAEMPPLRESDRDPFDDVQTEVDLLPEGRPSIAAVQTLTDVGPTDDPVIPPPAREERPESASPGRPARRELVLPPDLVAAGESRRCQRHELLFREGEVGHELFLLRRGKVELIKWEQTPRRNRIEALEPGACFGELALFGDGRRHVSCRALSEVEVVAIPRKSLREAFAATPTLERELRGLYRNRLQDILLRTSPLLSAVPEEHARAVLRRFKPMGLKAGEVVIAEGAPASGLFLVLLGRLRVSGRPAPTVDPAPLGALGDGDFFGEISLLRERQSGATVQCAGFVQLLHLPPAECRGLLADYPRLVEPLEAEARRREGVSRAILRGAASFDEARGAVVCQPRR